MDDGYSDSRAWPRQPGRLLEPVRRRSMARHHRRRRALALIAVLGALAAAGFAVIEFGLPGSGTAARRTRGTGISYVRWIAALANSAPISAGPSPARAENAAIDRTLAATP